MKIEGINAGHLHKYLICKKIPLLSVRVHENQPVELIFDEDKIPPGKREEIVDKAYALVNAYQPVGLLERLKRFFKASV